MSESEIGSTLSPADVYCIDKNNRLYPKGIRIEYRINVGLGENWNKGSSRIMQGWRGKVG